MGNRKDKPKWTRGEDWIDGQPRYTFEGRDPSYTVSTIQVVVCAYRDREYLGGPMRRYYETLVYHNDAEAGITHERMATAKEAKLKAIEDFKSIVRQYGLGYSDAPCFLADRHIF